LLWAERLCTGPLSDHIIAPSRQVAATLTRLAHVPAQKIELVQHGIDLQWFDPEKTDRVAGRRELGVDGELVFGTIGRFYRLKNYPALLEAFASVLPVMPEARLVVVGAGEASTVRSLADDLGISAQLLVCPPRTDIRELLAAFDVFVHPAIAESFGLVILEAMAMARPVLATPVGIAPELIVPGVTGFLCSSGSAGALADGLRCTLASRARWRQIGAAARQRVEPFTAVSMASRYEERYERWTRDSRRSGAKERPRNRR
jgi:glycosyltransferase involved in cell wall biosynthesis